MIRINRKLEEACQRLADKYIGPEEHLNEVGLANRSLFVTLLREEVLRHPMGMDALLTFRDRIEILRPLAQRFSPGAPRLVEPAELPESLDSKERSLRAESNRAPQRGIKVYRLPGTRLLRLVDFFYHPNTVKCTFKPLIADWQAEYFNAYQENRTVKARWICVRYYWAFFAAIGLTKLFSLVKYLGSIRK